MSRKDKRRRSQRAETPDQKTTAPVVQTSAPPPAPSSHEQRAIEEAAARVTARRPRAQVVYEQTPLGIGLVPPHADENGHGFQIHDAFGTTSTGFANAQLAIIMRVVSNDRAKLNEHRINSVLALVDGLKPENELEAALAVQIGLTHQVACDMLVQMKNTTTGEHAERYINLATKLQRTMVSQIEALTKLRHIGERPSVGQVTVNEGGRAIVGPVTYTKGAGDGSDG